MLRTYLVAFANSVYLGRRRLTKGAWRIDYCNTWRVVLLFTFEGSRFFSPFLTELSWKLRLHIPHLKSVHIFSHLHSLARLKPPGISSGKSLAFLTAVGRRRGSWGLGTFRPVRLLLMSRSQTSPSRRTVGRLWKLGLDPIIGDVS